MCDLFIVRHIFEREVQIGAIFEVKQQVGHEFAGGDDRWFALFADVVGGGGTFEECGAGNVRSHDGIMVVRCKRGIVRFV